MYSNKVTGPNRDLSVENRDLGTVVSMEDGRMTLRMDGKSARIIAFDPAEFCQFDHGYAVTSHSSQGLTAGRVLAHIDTDSSRSLINNRLAYVSISRASDDARIYTNNAESLGERLASTVTKTSAIDVSKLHRLSDLGGVSSRSGPEVEFEGFGIAL